MFKLGKMIETFADKTPVAVLVRAVLQRELDPEQRIVIEHKKTGTAIKRSTF